LYRGPDAKPPGGTGGRVSDDAQPGGVRDIE
jgi:hypothetical protein